MMIDIICLILIFLLALLTLTTPKLNISGIIKGHLNTLKSLDKKKYEMREIFIFGILPLLIAFIFSLKLNMNSEKISLIITAFSIFIGFLLNLLLLLYDLLFKARNSENLVRSELEKVREERRLNSREKSKLNFIEDKKNLLKEIYSNISFLIFLSTSIVVFCFPFIIKANIFLQHKELIKKGLIFIMLYLIFLFILTLLMVLKRINNLLKNEFEIDA